jgi:hypothetical protein
MQHITHDNEIEINGYQSHCLFRQSIVSGLQKKRFCETNESIIRNNLYLDTKTN